MKRQENRAPLNVKIIAFKGAEFYKGIILIHIKTAS